MSETSIFGTLYQGPCNCFACAALNSVAHTPGESYNPLWIYGPSGVGKTALLSATIDALRDHPSRPTILHIQAEELVRDLVRAIQRDRIDDFRARILSFRVILVDHADCLSCKAATQRTIAQLLLDAVNQGSQVILASCCNPNGLLWMKRVFTATCEWKYFCNIFKPSEEERLDITRQLTQSMNLPLPEPMICRIAEAARTPSRIRCIIHHLTARRKLLRLEDAALSEALEHLLEKEFCV